MKDESNKNSRAAVILAGGSEMRTVTSFKTSLRNVTPFKGRKKRKVKGPLQHFQRGSLEKKIH